MKKFLIALLLLPTTILAENETLDLECENIKIDNAINCTLYFENNSEYKINSISFFNTNVINTANSQYKFENVNNKYTFYLNQTNNKKFELLKFKARIEDKKIDFNYSNIFVDVHEETDLNLENLEKTITIVDKAKLDKILINGTELKEFNPNVYEYEIKTYDDLKYYEIQSTPNNNSSVLKGFEKKLVEANSKITIEVENEFGKEKYILNFIKGNKDELIKNIKINEFDHYYSPNKFYYYLNVGESTNTLAFNYDGEEKIVKLAKGRNEIKIEKNNLIYTYYITRTNVDEYSNTLKSLKINNEIIELEDNKFNYSIDKPNSLNIELTFNEENQDYDIKYYENKVEINLYGLNGKRNQYIIEYNENNNNNVEITEYNNTNSIIIFIIFSILTAVLGFILLKKYLKNKIND